MGYCKKCFDHFSGDCILSNDVCVFCHYGIDSWDSNGSVISRKEALRDLEDSFLSWRKYYMRYYQDIKKAIRNSPKGSFIRKKIKGHYYFYLEYREGEKVKYKYCGKKVPDDLYEGISLRKQLIKKLVQVESLLYALRISKRPIKRTNSFQILQRDGFACRYCGRTPKDGVKLHVDHIVPLNKGGENVESNLITACQKCNLEKHDRYD